MPITSLNQIADTDTLNFLSKFLALQYSVFICWLLANHFYIYDTL